MNNSTQFQNGNTLYDNKQSNLKLEPSPEQDYQFQQFDIQSDPANDLSFDGSIIVSQEQQRPHSAQNYPKYHPKSKSARKKRVVMTVQKVMILKNYFQSRRLCPKANENTSNLKDVSQKCGLGYSTVRKLKKQWKTDPNLTKTIVNIQKKKRIKAQYITMMEHYLKEIMSESQQPKIVEQIAEKIRSKMPERYRLKVTYHSVYHVLTKLNYRFRRQGNVINNSNPTNLDSKKRKYCCKIEELFNRKHEVYFLDLDQFTLKQKKVQKKGWKLAKQSERSVLDRQGDDTLYFIAALGSNRLCYWNMTQDNSQHQNIEKALRSILKHIKQKSQSLSRFMVCPLYFRLKFREFVSEAERDGFQFVEMPEKSGYLSPVTHWIIELKVLVDKQDIKSIQELHKYLFFRCNCFRSQHFQTYFQIVLKSIHHIQSIRRRGVK